MTGSDNFIRRWARLKGASDTAHEIEPVSASVEPTAAEPQAAGLPDEPFDSASLPSLESIASETDIGGVLQSGVPAEWTRAALCRRCPTDPAHSEFIGSAHH